MDTTFQKQTCEHEWKWKVKNKHRYCVKCGLNQKGYTLFSKSDCAIPERFAIAMQEDNWILRNKIIWYKRNHMPTSVKDRMANSWEYLFFFSKNKKYYFDLDAIREPHKTESIERVKHPLKNHPEGQWAFRRDGEVMNSCHPKGKNPGDIIKFENESEDFWDITTRGYPEAHFACVSEDTEMLTIDGWKKYTEIKWYSKCPKHILVATYNLKRQIIEYQPLSYIRKYDCDKIVKIGNRDLNVLVTNNHRNIVKKKTGQEIIVTTDNLTYSDKIRVSAPVNYPENKGIGKTFAELVGWIISEGHYKKGGWIEIYQNENNNAKRIDYLINKLEIPHTRKVRNRRYKRQLKKQVVWFLKKSPLVEWCLVNIPNKKLNKFLVSLPQNEIKLLFNGLIRGDGHVRKDDGRVSFIQKDKETKDWFQILALRLGYHSIQGKDVYLTKREYIGIRNTNGKGKSISTIKYKGKVWCPKTPNGTWIARRNGRIFITGNTFPEKLIEKPIKTTRKNAMIMDIFAGSGTTLAVARRLGRDSIGIEIKPEYIKLIRKRLFGMNQPLINDFEVIK